MWTWSVDANDHERTAGVSYIWASIAVLPLTNTNEWWCIGETDEWVCKHERTRGHGWERVHVGAHMAPAWRSYEDVHTR